MATSPPSRQELHPERTKALGTVADLLHRLGRISPSRVRLHPAPGTATERDLIAANDLKQGLCELVEGTLVEKPMGFEESELAALIIMFLNQFVRERKLGLVTAPDGLMRLATGEVRAPDIAFIARSSFPGGQPPRGPIPTVAPDLAIEILSKSNTKAEIARKLREYFGSGTKLVWLVDLKSRSVRVHSSPTESTVLGADAILGGGTVLPGFQLVLAEIFPNATS